MTAKSWSNKAREQYIYLYGRHTVWRQEYCEANIFKGLVAALAIRWQCLYKR